MVTLDHNLVNFWLKWPIWQKTTADSERAFGQKVPIFLIVNILTTRIKLSIFWPKLIEKTHLFLGQKI